ncbi:tyrosine-protein phosphatase [Novosphingobium sp. MW5]|nr:tyrosine-protein phosphatase [Novosphingobium sp. MW5]
MANDRTVNLMGVHNFRDYGGYAVAGGGRIRRALLWRSGQHFEASDEDLQRIELLRLANVFDLRSAHERASHPCRRPVGFGAQVHTIADHSAIQAPHIASAQRTAESTRLSMMRSYVGMPYRPLLVEMVGTMLRRLADGEGPSLVNCMAGKDRTGFAVAMVHHALGVHLDDIVADYLLTNTAGNPEERIAAGQRAARHLIGEIEPESLRVLMGVEPEYLATAWQAMQDSHGSVDAYQAEMLGVDDALREQLRAVLVES